MMKDTANFGDTVKVHYIGKLTTGEVFDSSYESDSPIEFTIGSGMMIQGFEEGVIGLSFGEEKTLNIPKEKAYGELVKDLIFPVKLNKLPPDLNPQVGMELSMSNPEDPNLHPIQVIVEEVHSDQIVINANHQLAGHDLIFDVKIVGILKAM